MIKTYYGIYIADGHDPKIKWNYPGKSELPDQLGPEFPIPGGARVLAVASWVESDIYLGVKLDWGAWAIRVTKADIREIVDRMYSKSKLLHEISGLPHLIKRYREFNAFVDELDKDELYALVAWEV